MTGGVRHRIARHLTMAFPELEQDQCRALARRVLAHLGTTLGELLYLSTRGCPDLLPPVRVEGWENVQELRNKKKPILYVTGHCGNWEMLAAASSCLGVPVYAFARGTEDPQLQGLLLDFRERFGSFTIARGDPGSARKILKVLRHLEGAMGILIDQDTRVEGVWVPFFGRPAFTPVGAAELALKQNVQVVPTFIEREENGNHLARFLPPVALPPDPEAATALLTGIIEDQIRRRPEQWVWSHRRWRRQPSS
jgi:KDO2-lipid IV(A) lauroyltransferase